MSHFISFFFEPTFSLHSTSPGAAEITKLFIWVNIVCALIFLVVAVWVGYSVFKFRYRGEEGEPDQHQIPKIYEITWTVIPALICVLFGWWTVVSLLGPNVGEVTPEEAKNPDVIVTGVQWWWDIRYPKLGVIAANELHVPVGKPLIVDLQSADVIHTFWIYNLGRKEQMIPGHHHFIKIEQDKAGDFFGACAQYCGNQHAWMRLKMIADTPEEFAAWAARQTKAPVAVSAPAPVPASPASASKAGGNALSALHAEAPVPAAAPAVVRGAQIYAQQTCGNCHAVEGVSKAQFAPDLSHLAGRTTLGAGVFANTHENLTKWIADPQAIKPGCNMPNFHFTPEETSDLVAYLETLK